MSGDGFRYLSPWLPMRDGWYRLGHVGAKTGDRVHRWRLCKSHEQNAASGERWERWRLFYDASSVVHDGTVCAEWLGVTELPASIRDRAHAGEVVEQRFVDLCDEAKQRRRGRPAKEGAST
jgi:hypothetical protein